MEEQAQMGEHIHETHRFFPLSSVYFFIDHEGGELGFGAYDELDEEAGDRKVFFP